MRRRSISVAAATAVAGILALPAPATAAGFSSGGVRADDTAGSSTPADDDHSTQTLVAAESARASRVAALTPSAAARLRPTIARGDSTPAVVFLQRKLAVQPVSGYFGPITEAAVRALQKKYGLKVTGSLNAATWKVLLAAKGTIDLSEKKATTAKRAAKKSKKPDSSTAEQPKSTTTSTETQARTATPSEAAAKRPVLRFGMGPGDPAIIFVQQLFHVTPESGYFGALTRNAVLAYQKGLGMTPTGVVGPKTWAAIAAGTVPADPAPVADPAPATDPEAPTTSADAAASPAPTVTQTPSPATIPTPTVTLTDTSTIGERALAYALAQVGKPYVMGGNGPDVFDCSGLMQQAYLTVGISLPRLASQQQYIGTQVALENLSPGDLLYYQDGTSPRRGHISMYAGNGLAVEAANPRRGVRIRPLNEGWYAERFVRATHLG